MMETKLGPCECSLASRSRKGFVGKTIGHIFDFIQDAFATESFSRRDGLLQSLDPRVKLIAILTVIFALSLTRDLRVLFVVYLLTLLFSYVSKIDILFFVGRVWLFIPIFTGVISIPILFNVFLPGDILFPVAHLGSGAHLGPFSLPESIYITKQGAHAAAVFTLRVAVSVSAVVLLFLTTSQQLLFKSLRSVGVPKLYVLTLGMTYRYIFLLLETARDMHVAKKARTIKSRSLSEEQKWVGGSIGYILIKSIDLSERVHSAMISRGFSGEFKTLEDFQLNARDYVAGAFGFSLSIILVLISQNIIRI